MAQYDMYFNGPIEVLLPLSNVTSNTGYLSREVMDWCLDDSRKGKWYAKHVASSYYYDKAKFFFDDPDTAFEFKMRWA